MLCIDMYVCVSVCVCRGVYVCVVVGSERERLRVCVYIFQLTG